MKLIRVIANVYTLVVTHIRIAKLVCDECVRVIGVTEVLHLNLEVAGPTRCEGNDAVVGAVIIVTDEVVVLVINIKVEVGVTVAAKNDGGIFTITKVTGGSYKEYGYRIDSGSKRFTNPPLKDNVADLTTKVFATTTNNRNDWEAQVLFLNEEGMYAIRSCNTADATSSWGDAGRTYWTYVPDRPRPLS